ncbi:MAG: hypothetical protein AVDCRST_MAG12-3535 [uncultured Rubrobacteraceae bacterium]|uniref:Uncharacterized protein n=1 Tax=uncultured Rubrobacteraceae bacterium TaxID=349277 RepID=A0A6J4T9E5_9ACTN|nr:MAG: hypothetical protein AVDCRST_MAG12-3535 [uncultured Rubrobacteraceae bacterium]
MIFVPLSSGVTPVAAGDVLAVTKTRGSNVCRDTSGASTVYHASGRDKIQDRGLRRLAW